MMSSPVQKSEISRVAAKTSSKKTKRKIAPQKSSKGEYLWNDIRLFLDEAEAKLEEFGERMDKVAAKMGKKVESKRADFEGGWAKTQDWLRSRLTHLKAFEGNAKRLFDTARVKAHLGKMEADDVVDETEKRLDRLKGRIDGLLVKASAETAEGLKDLSDACLALRNKIASESRHAEQRQ